MLDPPIPPPPGLNLPAFITAHSALTHPVQSPSPPSLALLLVLPAPIGFFFFCSVGASGSLPIVVPEIFAVAKYL